MRRTQVTPTPILEPHQKFHHSHPLLTPSLTVLFPNLITKLCDWWSRSRCFVLQFRNYQPATGYGCSLGRWAGGLVCGRLLSTCISWRLDQRWIRYTAITPSMNMMSFTQVSLCFPPGVSRNVSLSANITGPYSWCLVGEAWCRPLYSRPCPCLSNPRVPLSHYADA